MKMHSHIVEFPSSVFAHFYVRSTLSIIIRQCLKFLKVNVKGKLFSNSQGFGNRIHIPSNKL